MTALQYSLPCLTSIILLSSTVSAFQVPCYKHPASITVLTDARQSSALSSPNPTVLSMSDWSDFSALDDEAEDDLLELKVDKRDYAVEEDSQESKAQVGKGLQPPEIENDAPPIDVPAGSQLELDEETVMGVLSAARGELGTLFGYSAENRGVGITGGVDYVELDGPSVIVRLKGRFWHTRPQVLARVSNYLIQRIPEIVEVNVEDEWQLTNEANEEW